MDFWNVSAPIDARNQQFPVQKYSQGYHRKSGEENNKYIHEDISLPSFPWPKSNLETPSSTKTGKRTISWKRESADQEVKFWKC